jgi:hypothetical protein
MNEALRAARGGSMIEEPIFLVGTTRSGTTLLSLMLGHHPEIAFVGEFEWVWDFEPTGATPSLETYYAWLSTHRHFRHHQLRVDRSLGFEDLLRNFLEQMRADVGPVSRRLHVGCQVHRHYAQALSIWPRARFIHIVRDGRDVCASWIKLGWLGNAYEAGLRWQDALAEWATVRPRIDSTRRIELRFEDLIQGPEEQLARLCEFIGTEYSSAMLRYYEDTTYGPVDQAQANKWRGQLTRREIRLFEAVASQDLIANGYALSGEPPYVFNAWSPLILRVHGKLRHHRARARIYGPRLWLEDILARRLGSRSWRDRIRLALNEIDNSRLK